MKMDRVNELLASMKSFEKEAYHKSELLDEMFALQKEIVALTFDGEHAETADLKIWDVKNHLEQMNQDCGNVADEELKRFEEGCRTFINLIKAEVSGNRGEFKAFRSFEFLHTDHIVLKNVELQDGGLRTEIDAVVITPYGITIVEVKNTARNIFIGSNGGYYRTGEFLKQDCNIAQKMDLKEKLLRKALAAGGFENLEINQVVVFTDNRIEVQNKYRKIHTCFVDQLAYIIDGFKDQGGMSRTDMGKIEDCIRRAEHKEVYPFGFDVKQYKTDFATLMAVLEEASARIEEDSIVKEVVTKETKKESFKGALKSAFKSKLVRYAGSAAAGVAISLITMAMFDSVRK